MVKFSIIESNNSAEENKEYEEFKKYYMHTLRPVWQIKELLNISQSKKDKYVKKIRKENGFSRDKKLNMKLSNLNNKNNTIYRLQLPQYYYSINNKFKVYKRINGKTKHFGTYPTKKEAKKVVEWLKKHNWSKESLKEMKT